MSFSLSSLLNPSPTGVVAQDNTAPITSPIANDNRDHANPERRDSLPPISYVQSPEMQHAQLPKYTPPQRQKPFAGANASTIIGADAVASATQLHGHDEQAGPHAIQQVLERGSSGGYPSVATLELPPPPPSNGDRKMSSPTLEQYQVASRSPEQRRPNLATPMQSAFTLPPLQNVSSSERDAIPSFVTQPQNESESQGLARVESSDQLHSGARESDPPTNTLSNETQPQLQVHPQVGDLPEKSPINIKQEIVASPGASSPVDVRNLSTQNTDLDHQTSKTVASLKQEHASRTQSPLREASVPVPSTENAAASESMPPKKKPAPPKGKKGTATASKKAPTKKRKLDSSTSTPTSQRPSAKSAAFKANGSGKGTPTAASSPTPSDARSFIADDQYEEEESAADSDEDVEGSGDVYCICRKPDNGTFMIGCDGQCDDWFHGKCVGIEERNKNLIDKYICPSCTDAGVGRTTWKRICRRHGCRQPARVGKNAPKAGGSSKYCSDECGVLFFREMNSSTRGREQLKKDRAGRRKLAGNADSSDQGARGGVLSSGEVHALLDQSNTFADFKSLGDGVLSPPATPPSDSNAGHDDSFTDAERQALDAIAQNKEQARERHQVLKDRLKFVSFVKNASSQAATEKDLKPKDYCGFDSRIEWSEDEFAAWRHSARGEKVFELENLDVSGTETNTVNGDHADNATVSMEDEPEVCERKKCARHTDWSKLAVDDVRFEMTDNSDRMRALEQEERELRQRVALRAKARYFGEDQGSVEVHGLGITDAPNDGQDQDVKDVAEVSEAMEVDTAA